MANKANTKKNPEALKEPHARKGIQLPAKCINKRRKKRRENNAAQILKVKVKRRRRRRKLQELVECQVLTEMLFSAQMHRSKNPLQKRDQKEEQLECGQCGAKVTWRQAIIAELGWWQRHKYEHECKHTDIQEGVMGASSQMQRKKFVHTHIQMCTTIKRTYVSM